MVGASCPCYADGMVTRRIDLDDETDRILTELAQEYEGNLGDALADLLRARESLEAFASESEDAYRDLLLSQVQRAERGFREGRFTTWEEVKRRNRL